MGDQHAEDLGGGHRRPGAPGGPAPPPALGLGHGTPVPGTELDRATTPFEAGLGRVVKLEKGSDFVGREALAAVAETGPARRPIRLKVTGRGTARPRHPI